MSSPLDADIAAIQAAEAALVTDVSKATGDMSSVLASLQAQISAGGMVSGAQIQAIQNAVTAVSAALALFPASGPPTVTPPPAP